ncbi:phage tail assembly chaperone [Paraburkholderia fungorum]|uniref:phage tail assembly chaperone n=1 Tax=Paraburkholderia fungorum TaxID=134537 RepID=UPI003877CF99
MGQKYAAYDDTRAITGFYDSSICPPPKGLKTIAITDEQHAALLAGQSAGKRMAVDADNKPVLLDSLPPTDAQLDPVKRGQRDAALKASDWFAARHQDELLIGKGTSLNAAQLDELLIYRKALRDLPESPDWPNVELPAAPSFVTAIA